MTHSSCVISFPFYRSPHLSRSPLLLETKPDDSNSTDTQYVHLNYRSLTTYVLRPEFLLRTRFSEVHIYYLPSRPRLPPYIFLSFPTLSLRQKVRLLVSLQRTEVTWESETYLEDYPGQGFRFPLDSLLCERRHRRDESDPYRFRDTPL